MAEQTNPNLEKALIYSAFIRNHTPEGTFRAFEKDLDRIASMGTDIIWLMPIHPCGIEKRKGKDGSPYAIADYRATAPEMGTEEDLRHLVDEIHKRGMKCIIDVVYNHTSPDSVLYKEHPEWFYHDENGNPASLVADWSDIIDLDYSNKDLWDYQTDTLIHWAGIVDGFRCDVASRIPLEYWLDARKKVEDACGDKIWLAESVHYPFLKFVRDLGRPGVSDGDLYQAFDMEYDYDIWPYFEDYLVDHKIPLSGFIRELERQESLYPENYIKMHCLENHDQPRIASFARDEHVLKNWLAFLFFLKGTPLIYHGQERGIAERTDFFTQEVIDWNRNCHLEKEIAALAAIHKQLPVLSPIDYICDDAADSVEITRPGWAGVFCFGSAASVDVTLVDGTWTNEINGKTFVVDQGKISSADLPVIVKTADEK